ncbi:MAG: hypothetical protein CMB23_01630 [Euryarchaeota archaeon]|nr:hypothetical protein [Euryarchaeota archaeon]
MNLGIGDRVVRLIGGCGVVVFDYFSSAQWELIFLIVGLWTVATSVVGHCPFYSSVGISTCKVNSAEPIEN